MEGYRPKNDKNEVIADIEDQEESNRYEGFQRRDAQGNVVIDNPEGVAIKKPEPKNEVITDLPDEDEGNFYEGYTWKNAKGEVMIDESKVEKQENTPQESREELKNSVELLASLEDEKEKEEEKALVPATKDKDVNPKTGTYEVAEVNVEKGKELIKYVGNRSAELDVEAKKLGVEGWFRRQGEAYNKLNWKTKLGVGLALGIGAAAFSTVSVPLALACVSDLALQRVMGMSSVFMKFEKSKNFAKLTANVSEERRKADALAMAAIYSIGAGYAIGKVVNWASDTSLGHSVHDWLNNHWPFGHAETPAPVKPPVAPHETVAPSPVDGSSEIPASPVEESIGVAKGSDVNADINTATVENATETPISPSSEAQQILDKTESFDNPPPYPDSVEAVQPQVHTLEVDVQPQVHETITNDFGAVIRIDEPHIYNNLGAEDTFVFGGSPTEKTRAIFDYLTKNPGKVVIGTDDSGNYRVPYSLIEGKVTAGPPMKTEGFLGLFKSFIKAPEPNELETLIQ